MQVPGDERKVDNLLAQVDVLNRQLQQTVQKTQEAVDLRDSYLLEVESLTDRLEELRVEQGGVEEQIVDATMDLSVLRHLINSAQNRHQLLVSQTDVEKKRLDKEKNALEAQISDLRTKLEKEVRNYEQRSEEISRHMLQLNEMRDAVEAEIRSLEDRMHEAADNYDEVKAFVDSKKNELAEESKKLADREKELERRERIVRKQTNENDKQAKANQKRAADLAVFARRIQKAYEVNYPSLKFRF